MERLRCLQSRFLPSSNQLGSIRLGPAGKLQWAAPAQSPSLGIGVGDPKFLRPRKHNSALGFDTTHTV